MQFTLRSILLALVVIGSAVGAFGPWGLLVALAIVAGAALVAAGRVTPFGFVLTLGTIGILGALVPPGVRGAREDARRATCQGCHLVCLALALHNYHNDYGSLPPAFVPGPDGTPWHSWRVLILPYIEERDLYDAYNFNEPWNGPNNSKLAASIPGVFVCPSLGSESQGIQTTSYVAVVGPRTMWPGAKARRFGEVKDGLSNTIMLVEAAPAGIHWMEPRDLLFEDLGAPEGRDPAECPLGAHRGEPGWFVVRDGGGLTHVALGDGSRHAIPWNTPDGLAPLLTVDGGEAADIVGLSYSPPRYRIHWPRTLSLVVLALSSVLFWFSVRRTARDSRTPADPASS